MREKIKTIRNTDELEEFFGIKKYFFDNFDLVLMHPESIQKLRIKKRRWWFRYVYIIKNPIYGAFIDKLKKTLNEIYASHDAVHWFVKRRSNVTNAKNHLNKKVVVNVDIKNFFESISIECVESLLLDNGWNNFISKFIAKSCCYNGKLSTWFATSPVISNMVCRTMDDDLSSISIQRWYKYTRYCDDMTFSWDWSRENIRDDVLKVLDKYGFTINSKKYREQYKWFSQYVTWLTVCEKDRPRIPKKIKKNLRLEAYYIKKYGEKEHMDRGKSRLKWAISFLWRVDYIRKLEPKLVEYIESCF